MNSLSRRKFLHHVGVLASATWFNRPPDSFVKSTGMARTLVSQGADRSRVVIAHRTDLRTAQNRISSENVARLLEQAIESLFQTKASLVWKTLFKPSDTVGLKVNCLAGKGLSTNWHLVEAVIENLLRAGVAKQRIIVWDRLDRDLERAGYPVYDGNDRPRCFGTNRVGYSKQIYEFGSVGSLLSRILTEHCSALINLPVLKDHGIVGVSLAMKNFFGVINNPNKYHDNAGDPFVADLLMIPEIRQKTRLHICDSLTPQYEGGPPFMPEFTWQMDSLMAATDMVALDQIGWTLIEEQRTNAGLKSLKQVGREPSYIATAADSRHCLGTNQSERIEVVKA